MEKAEDVLGLGLSAGFKFQPEDDELVQYFLLRRILGQPLPFEGLILEDDPLSAPPWKLLDKHEREEDDAFFFANGQPMHDNGSRRQKRSSCVDDGCWAGQKPGVKGNKLRVPGKDITWKKYQLNFQPQGQNVSTGWVMHEYSITEPADLASSPLRLYRVRFSGHGEGRKREPDDYAQAKAAAANSVVPMVDLVDDEDGGSAMPAGTSYSEQDYQNQWVNAMHNAPHDFAVPNYAGPGTASAQQYFEEHIPGANYVFPVVDQDYQQYQCKNGTYDWNQVDSSQNLVVPSSVFLPGAEVGPAEASSNQYFQGGNTMNLGAHSDTPPSSDQGAPGVMNEYDGAAPAAGMLPFGQGSSSGVVNESFLDFEHADQDINVDDYLVYYQEFPDPCVLEAPLDDRYSSDAIQTQSSMQFSARTA